MNCLAFRKPIASAHAAEHRAEMLALNVEPDRFGRIPPMIEALISLWDGIHELEFEHDPADEPLLDDAEFEPWHTPAHLEGGGGREMPNNREIAAVEAIGNRAPILRKLWDDEGDLTEEWIDASGAVQMKPIACGIARWRGPLLAASQARG